MLTVTHLPPAWIPNGARVYPESLMEGTTVHADPNCPVPARELYRCTAIQAAVYLAPRWCPGCAGRSA